jgi:dihydrofolate reductase
MRKVVLYELLSLDGVAEEPGNWFFDSGPELLAFLGQVTKSQDEVLLGRGTYDYWVGYWPKSDFEPFASFINRTRKHVFSSHPLADEWTNTTLVTTRVPEYVRALSALPGGDIGVHGSITLARSLLRARLIHELRLVVAPTIAGRGRRLFDQDDDATQRLELMDVQRSRAGTLFLTYRCLTATS